MSEARDGTGKIERLPWELREQVCRKLRDGEPGAKICKWLNALPEVLKVLDEHFGEQPVSAQNLSAFKTNGYQKWLARQSRNDRVRELAAVATQISQASGGTLSDGASQLLSGQILEVLEKFDELREQPPGATNNEQRTTDIAASIESLTLSVSRLRKSDQNARVLEQRDRQLGQTDQRIDMERKKLMRSTAEVVLKAAAENRVQEISASQASHADKIERLGKLIFEDLWK